MGNKNQQYMPNGDKHCLLLYVNSTNVIAQWGHGDGMSSMCEGSGSDIQPAMVKWDNLSKTTSWFPHKAEENLYKCTKQNQRIETVRLIAI